MKHIIPLLLVTSIALSATGAPVKDYGPIQLTLDHAYYYQASGTADPSRNGICEGYLIQSGLLPSLNSSTLTLGEGDDGQHVTSRWKIFRNPTDTPFNLKPRGISGSYAFGTWYKESGRRVFDVQVSGVTFTAKSHHGAPGQPYISEIIVLPPTLNDVAFSCVLTNATEQAPSIKVDRQGLSGNRE